MRLIPSKRIMRIAVAVLISPHLGFPAFAGGQTGDPGAPEAGGGGPGGGPSLTPPAGAGGAPLPLGGAPGAPGGAGGVPPGTPGFPPPAGGGQPQGQEGEDRCYSKLVKECEHYERGALQGLGGGLAAANQGGLQSRAAGQEQALGTTVAQLQAARAECKKRKDRCEEECKNVQPEEKRKKETEYCLAFLAWVIDSKLKGQQDYYSSVANKTGEVANKAQGQGQGQGEGMSPLAAGLIGAALGAGMALLASKLMGGDDDDKDENKDTTTSTDGSTTGGGASYDCSTDSENKAYKLEGCNEHLVDACIKKINDKTYGADTKCTNFTARYCGSTGSTTTTDTTKDDLGDGLSTASTAGTEGAVGEGLGTDYCQLAFGWGYCYDSSAKMKKTYEMCPSCLRLKKNKSLVCEDDPSACLAQNSPAQIEKAEETCPGDPAFSDPTYAAGGGAQVPKEANQGGSLPAVILPQSQSEGHGTGSTSVSASTSASGAGSPGSKRLAARATGASEGAAREGLNAGASRGASSSGSSSSVSLSYASVNGERGTASVSGTGGGGEYGPASTGPAADVQGRFGPSVFALGTEVIRKRCEAGKFLNCP
ncbi:MAG: hypothetical protein AB7G93_16130 [Bdellovibrionales bacterium]